MKKATKLTLAKETLRRLVDGRLREAQVAGGASGTCTCSQCESVCDFCTN